MATKLQCEICGGKLVGKPGGIFECDSCGTEYSTEWAKAKIQEISGTVKVEGTVEVTGKVQVEGGTVQVDTTANKDALLKRAFMMLEDKKWDKADELLEQVLNIDPECGEAYLGKLMIELKVRTRKELKELLDSFEEKVNYQRAYQYGNAKIRKILDEAVSQIHKQNQQSTYEAALWCMKKHRYCSAIDLFKHVSGYLDSDDLRKTCISLAKKAGSHRRQICSIAKKLIAVGGFHTVGLKTDGTVLAIGDNKYGQCNTDKWSDIVAVAAGEYHTIGLKEDGTVIAIGENRFNQCTVETWRNISAITASDNYTIGIKEDGTVVATGDNSNGQCNVSSWRNIVAISAGGGHTVGLRADGTVVATGRNEHGECDVSNMCDIASIDASENKTIGIKKNGSLIIAGILGHRQEEALQWKNIIMVKSTTGNIVGLNTDGDIERAPYDPYASERILSGENFVAIDLLNDHTYPSYTFGIRYDGTVIAPKYTKQNFHKEQCNVSDWTLFEDVASLEKRYQEIDQHKKEIRSKQLKQRQELVQALKTELTNLKGLFSGYRRKELEAQISDNNKEIERLQAELKTLS